MSAINEKEYAILESLILSKNTSNILNTIENALKELEKSSFTALILNLKKTLLEKNDREAMLTLKKIEASSPDELLTICCRIIFYCYTYNQKNIQKYINDAKNLAGKLAEPTNSVESSFRNYVQTLCQWVASANQNVQALEISPFWKNFTEAIFDYSQEYKEEQARLLKEKKRLLAEQKKAEEQQRIAEEKRLAEEQAKKIAQEQKRKKIIKIILLIWLLPLIILEGLAFVASLWAETSPIADAWGLWFYITVAILSIIVSAISLQKKEILFMAFSHLYFWGPFILLMIASTALGNFIESYCMVSFLWGGAILTGVAILCIIGGIIGIKSGLNSIDGGECIGSIFLLLGIFFIVELVANHFWDNTIYWTIWICFWAISSLVLGSILLYAYINDDL